MTIEQLLTEQIVALKEVTVSIKQLQEALTNLPISSLPAKKVTKSSESTPKKTHVKKVTHVEDITKAPPINPTPSFKEVSKEIIELVKLKGRDAAMSLLSEFKVTRAIELLPEQYSAFLLAVTKAKGE